MRLGIDFGTTRTVVSASLQGRYAIANFQREDGGLDSFIPALVVNKGGALFFGWEAVSRLQSEEGVDGVLLSIKRVVSDMLPAEPVPGIGVEITALELVSAFLVHLKKALVERSNLELEGAPLEAMIAVPANATTRQRFLTLEGFRRAGFEVIGLLNEPSAAAIEYAHNYTNAISPRSPKRYVAVYDLGGGTFDTSILSLKGRRFSLLATEGIARLGGCDFDEAILQLVQEKLGKGDLKTELSPSAYSGLLEVCREAKESLKAGTRRMLIDADPWIEGEEVVLKTSDVYKKTLPLIEQSVAMIETLMTRLEELGIDPANERAFGGLYLVGGAVAFPGVQRALRVRFGRKVLMAPQPHASTAVGLAIAADPDAGILVREAVTRHIGVWREANWGFEKTFDVIFSKDDQPEEDGQLTVEREYVPVHAVGHLRFLECSELTERRQPAGELTPWREILFTYDPSLYGKKDLTPYLSQAASRRSLIRERYVYHPDGRVTCTIINETCGFKESFELGSMS